MQDLKTLRQHWYQKLADSGFKDIEGQGPYLKQWDSFQIPLTYEQDVADYYYYGEHFLHTNSWPCPTAREIWRLHIEGNSLRKIAQRVKWNKDKVNQLIISLRRSMLPTDNDHNPGSHP